MLLMLKKQSVWFLALAGTGTVQLIALGAYLESIGCSVWDLGMVRMSFKILLHTVFSIIRY